MSKIDVIDIVKLRLSVGLLGEKDQANWWPSVWFTTNASAFLSPIYGDRIDAARYHGVVEAARRVHDNRIGVGRAFHLFRLPESLERRLHQAVIDQEAQAAADTIRTKTDAEAFLAEIGNRVETPPGPLRIGSTNDLEDHTWLRTSAGHYLAAFKGSQQTFPYFAEAL